MMTFKTQITNHICPIMFREKRVYHNICVFFTYNQNIKKYYEITMHKINNKNILQIIIFNYNNELYLFF